MTSKNCYREGAGSFAYIPRHKFNRVLGIQGTEQANYNHLFNLIYKALLAVVAWNSTLSREDYLGISNKLSLL